MLLYSVCTVYVQHLCTCMYSVFRTYIHILHLVVVISRDIDIFHYTLHTVDDDDNQIEADSILVHSNYFHRAVLGCCKRKFLAASASHTESVIPFNFECTRIAVHLFCSQEKMSERKWDNQDNIHHLVVPFSPCHASPQSLVPCYSTKVQLPPSSVFCFCISSALQTAFTFDFTEDARRLSLYTLPCC
jgi:hypothetical protein